MRGRASAFSYALRAGNGEQEEVTESIPIVRVPYDHGGSRAYFLCPGEGGARAAAVGCGRRVSKLYLSRRYFLCRQCGQVVYAVRHERPLQRARSRARKLRQRLGVTGAGVPGKPKGMLVRTYARLLDAALRAETQATEACTDRIQRLIARIESRRSRRKPPPTKPLFTL